MAVTVCPECEAEIDFGNPLKVKEGDLVVCPECDIELEVISEKPLALDYAFDDEDWDDDWDEE